MLYLVLYSFDLLCTWIERVQVILLLLTKCNRVPRNGVSFSSIDVDPSRFTPLNPAWFTVKAKPTAMLLTQLIIVVTGQTRRTQGFVSSYQVHWGHVWILPPVLCLVLEE